MRSFVTIISMILLFTASASGQEAGDRARGLFRVEVQSRYDSIRNVVGSDQLIRRHWGPEGFVGIEGVITPMMDLETEDGRQNRSRILARDGEKMETLLKKILLASITWCCL